MVIWITGLSGAGKSTIANEVVNHLLSTGQPCILLDGDKIRKAIDDPHVGYDPESRSTCARRISRLAQMLEQGNIWVVVATISLFKDIHSWNRSNLKDYIEVYVSVDLEVLRKRDSKGLYSRAEKGEVSNVAGLHYQVQEPENPDLILENNSPLVEFSAFAQKIIAHIPQKYPNL
jgi:cytidine diphosphoramidate kinase